MKRKILLALVTTVALSLYFARSASAQLFLNVDTQLQQYYLSGTATGTPLFDPEFGEGTIFWDNGQPVNGGFTNFLSLAAFSVTGNTANSFTMFLHGNGDINGALDLSSGGATTLTGNPNVTFSYGGWAPALIAELESKALSGETVNVTEGSATFGLVFTTAAVPEPSSALLILIGGAGAAIWRGRVLRARTK
jgi:hypothetical protein